MSGEAKEALRLAREWTTEPSSTSWKRSSFAILAREVLRLSAEVERLRERIAQIRPLRESEWAVIYAEHDVLHAAQRLSRSAGVINTTAELDRALEKYAKAVEADSLAATEKPEEGVLPGDPLDAEGPDPMWDPYAAEEQR